MSVVRKALLLHPCFGAKCSDLPTLGYGVMVTLQILVLPFLVRVRVPQLSEPRCGMPRTVSAACAKFGVWCNGNTADSGPAFPGSSPGTPTRTQSLTALRFTSQRSFFDVLGRKSLKSQTNPTQPRNRLFRCVGFSFARCTIRK